MPLSLKKYLTSALKWLIAFVLVGVMCLSVCFVDNIDTGVFLAIVVPISCIALLLPGGYYLARFLAFKKKYMNVVPVEGVIANWEAGDYRYTGRIIVNVDGKEYSTSSYFNYEECKELVGKTVSYAIIDEILFIYEVKN